MDKLEEIKARSESLCAGLAAEKEKLAAFQRENAELKNAGKNAGAAAYFGRLRDEGKLPPARSEKAVALDTGLSDETRKGFREVWSGVSAREGEAPERL
ncbi:MAG: hypothetical protein LBB61_04575 [Treponema sp.]|jgi:hypothetical protein|nr:hypothetical protein [Treponema sp.]